MNCVPPSSSFGDDDSQDAGVAETPSNLENVYGGDDRGSASNYVHSGSISMMDPPRDFNANAAALNTNQAGPMAFPQTNFNDYQYNDMPSLPTSQQPYTTHQQFQSVPTPRHGMRPDADENWNSEDKEADLSDALHDLKINPVGVGQFEAVIRVSQD